MALVVADRVQETTTTTGTGTYTLAGAKAGFQSFGAVGDGNTTYYACTDGTDYEVGIGTYTASGTTLARTTIIESSNSDAAVNWGAGEKDIFVTLPASKATVLDASGNATFTGDVTFDGATAGYDIVFDRSDNALEFADNAKAVFGTGGDLELYHNASNSVIGNNTGTFFIVQYADDGDIVLRSDNSLGGVADYFRGDGSTGEAILYHYGSDIPSSLGTAGQVLTVNSGATAGEWASLPSVSLAEQEFTATSGQTVFTVTGGITDADNVSVYLNGAKLFSTDVTISAAANTVTLATGATTGDLVTVTEVAGAASGGGGASAFTGLSDTPASLGTAGQILQVNSGASALEFIDASSGGVTTGKAIAMAIVFG
jgi:hypothetical protein